MFFYHSREVETDENRDILTCFEKSNGVKYNTNNIMFNIKQENRVAWLKALEKKLGPSKVLENKTGVHFKQESWSLTSATQTQNFENISVSVYYKKKNGVSKVQLQGDTYIAYMTFVIPGILSEIREQEESSGSVDESLKVDAIDDQTEKNKMEPKKDASAAVDADNVQTLIEGFHRLQTEIVSLRSNMTEKLDAAAISLRNNGGLDDLKQEVGRLALALEGNKSDIEKVDQKLSEVLNMQKNETVEMSADQVDKLSIKIADDTTKHLKIDEITSAIDGLKNDVSKIEKTEDCSARNDIIISKLEEVKAASDTISKDVSKLGRGLENTFKDVAVNSSQSLDALNKMNINIESLVKRFIEIPVTPAPPQQPQKNQVKKLKKG